MKCPGFMAALDDMVYLFEDFEEKIKLMKSVFPLCYCAL